MHEVLDHRQADAQASLTRVRSLSLKKKIENFSQVILFDSATRIANAHDQPTGLLKDSPDDATFVGRELDRIGHQIGCHLADTFAVDRGEDRFFGKVQLYIKRFQIYLCLIRLYAVSHALSEINGRKLK